MEFRFQFSYSFEDLVVLNRVVRKTYQKKLYGFIRVVGVFFGALPLLLNILELLFGEMSSNHFEPIPGLAILALSIWYDQFNAWASQRLLIKGMGEIVVTLGEDGVREKSLKGEAVYPYQAFIGGFACRGRYMLFLDKKHAVILALEAMTQGDPTQLGPWLADKLGRNIVTIH